MMSQILPALISATGGGLLVAILNFILARPKARAEAAQIAGETAASMLVQLRTDLSDARHRLATVETDNHNLQAENREVHEHLWRLQSWIKRNYHPSEGDEPMPEFRMRGQ